MKVAMYKEIKHDYVGVHEAKDWIENSAEYVRISEIIEIEFSPLRPEETVHRELDILEAVENDLRAKFTDALAGLNERRSKLLALTHSAE